MTTMRAIPTARHHCAGLLLVAFLGWSLVSVATPALGQDQDKKEKGEEKPKGQEKGRAESPNALSDADVIGFVNEQLEKAWKENNIKSSGPAPDHA